jgi:6-phosphogluconate dehydrogenase
MQIGMIGLGRMGGNMVRRLIRGGHTCVVHDRSPDAVRAVAGEGAVGSTSLDDFIARLEPPRVVWLMLPAALVDTTIGELEGRLASGDIIIDGGNSFFQDDVDRAKRLTSRGLHYVDCGTSGGVWGLERGYCLMIGGEAGIVRHLDSIFATLAPGPPGPPEGGPHTPKGGHDSTAGGPHTPEGGHDNTAGGPHTPKGGHDNTASRGYLHCGPAGAGHFVKMVHNGIEYGLMAAYAEGFNILKHANVGTRDAHVSAEATPLRHPEYYQFDFDLAAVAEVWRHGSVISSWLLDLTASALGKSPDLGSFAGRVSDSGEGRWTLGAAIDEGVPAEVLAASLFSRFSSRGNADFQNRLLSAMRFEFGGHVEQR